MDDIATQVYHYMKSKSDENGFLPTVRQMSEQLGIEIREVGEALHKLEQQGKIVITDIPAKSIIELAE